MQPSDYRSEELLLISSFLTSLFINFNWGSDGLSLVVEEGEPLFFNRRFIITQLVDLNEINHVSLFQNHDLEIAIGFIEDKRKIYKCKRHKSDVSYSSYSLLEAIIKAVIDSDYIDKNNVDDLNLTLLQEKYNIPLESLGLSFRLIYLLKKNNLNDLKSIYKVSKHKLMILLDNKVLLDELSRKLKNIDIILS